MIADVALSLALTSALQGYEPMPENIECPVNDVGGYWQVKVPPIKYVRFITGPDALHSCGSERVVACADFGDEDGIAVGLIYSTYPLDSYHYRPHTKQHELCHLLGWQHGPWWLQLFF